MKTIVILLIGVITVYRGPQWEGQPLRCSRDRFTQETADRLQWLAWDFDTNGGRCGDLILITAGGKTRRFVAMDSGRFGHLYVRQPDGQLLPIIADVPGFFWEAPGISQRAVAFNWSAAQRSKRWRLAP